MPAGNWWPKFVATRKVSTTLTSPGPLASYQHVGNWVDSRCMSAHNRQSEWLNIAERMHTWHQCLITISEDILATKYTLIPARLYREALLRTWILRLEIGDMAGHTWLSLIMNMGACIELSYLTAFSLGACQWLNINGIAASGGISGVKMFHAFPWQPVCA